MSVHIRLKARLIDVDWRRDVLIYSLTVKRSNGKLHVLCSCSLDTAYSARNLGFISDKHNLLFWPDISSVSEISFPRIYACLLITKTYHSHVMSVRHFLHHHCHHPLLLLTSTPGSKLIFSTKFNLFLHSSSTFPPTGLTPWTLAVFRFSRACRY